MKPERKLDESNEQLSAIQQSKVRKLETNGQTSIMSKSISDFTRVQSVSSTRNTHAAMSLAILDSQVEKKTSIFESIDKNEKNNNDTADGVSLLNENSFSKSIFTSCSSSTASKSVGFKTKKYKLVKSKETDNASDSKDTKVFVLFD